MKITHQQKIKKFNKEHLEIAIKNSYTYSNVFKYLNLCPTNYNFLKKKIKEFNLDISHFNQSGSRKGKVKYKLEELLVLNGPVFNFTNLKSKLYKEGLKEKKCELCGQGEEWNGRKMSLILDHIDGNRYNNELINLRIVCPNCNATLDTHCGKNINSIEDLRKRKEVNKKIILYQKQEKQNKIIQIILSSNVNFNKKGWGVELGKVLNVSPQHSIKWVKENMFEFYNVKCFKHKDNKIHLNSSV